MSRSIRFLFVFFLSCCAITLGTPAEASKLKRVKGKVTGEYEDEGRGGGKPSEPSKAPPSLESSEALGGRSRPEECPGNDFSEKCVEDRKAWREYFAGMLPGNPSTATGPRGGNTGIPEPGDGYSMRYLFRRWPYADDGIGIMVHPPRFVFKRVEVDEEGGHVFSGNEDESEGRPRLRPVSLRLTGEYGYGFDRIQKPSAYFLLSTRFRLGLEAGATFFAEKGADGETVERLAIGDAAVIYRIAQSARLQFRGGVGARMMYDDSEAHWGFNGKATIDAFPAKPVVLSISLDVGNLGKAFFFRFKPVLGFAARMFEFQMGWDVWVIATDGLMSSTVIQGPTAGVRIWL